jgi:NADPH-dependent glutamate synthase beta subunit-like oxidoreductase/CO/xanthine dehydrogenase FAD-binding subunit
MKPFDHVDAKSVSEAVKSLKGKEGKVKLIAGGTDLLSTLKDKILPEYPETVVNIKSIPGMDYIKEDAKGLKIGATAKLEAIAQSPLVKKNYKILAEAAQAVATPQIRRMGTIGGNLCQDVRCWYYRYPHSVGGRILCYLKGGKGCYALTRENQNHSIFGGLRNVSPPCASACPGSVDIPTYLSRIREGDLDGAAKTLLESNPIPSVTGRVCPHFCEQMCNRGDFDEAVSVRDIERFVGDYILDNANKIIKAPRKESGKSVAIVGSGPAGLAAAYYLRMAGHRVTVFERREEAGGMLTYVIPAYRLPKETVRRVVKTIENTGVEFRCKVDVGKDVTLESLKKDYDGVFIASGAWNPVSIGLEGEEATRFGLDFLIDINRGIKKVPGKKVLVIGGGNAAVDVAVTALRLGAEEAIMACLESREEMPALPWEIELAEEQGVKIMTSWGPKRVLKEGGRVKGMELVRCTSVFDKQGRFAPTLNDKVRETVAADQIMMAVGYGTDLDFIKPLKSLQVERGLIKADTESQATGVAGVFAGGAVVHGPATVIEAIAAGKRAAAAIDAFLGGKQAKVEADKSFLKFNGDYLKETKRVEMPKRAVAERSLDTEDALGLKQSAIEGEANRCFNCGCVSASASDMGVVLLALGAKLKVAGPKGERTVPVGEFFGALRTTLEADEMVTGVEVPKPSPGARQTFVKFRLRESVDFPIVSAAALITVDGKVCKDAQIALGAVAPVPFRATEVEKAIKGKPLDAKTAEAAAKAAVEGTIPLSANAYKVEITKTVVKRAINP